MYGSVSEVDICAQIHVALDGERDEFVEPAALTSLKATVTKMLFAVTEAVDEAKDGDRHEILCTRVTYSLRIAMVGGLF